MYQQLKNTYLKFGYNFPLLIAFFLPFGINYALFIIFWTLSFFLFDEVKLGLKRVLNNKWSLVFILFFILHVFGYFFSFNKQDALNAIEIKLGFFIIPLLFFASNYNLNQVKKIIISFVSGTLLVSFMCLFRAFFLYFFKDVNAFFYSEFSYFLHPSYFAMYLVFAQFIVILFYPKWLNHLSHLSIKIGFISLVLLVTIFLCSSKMGLITAFLMIPSTLFVMLYKAGFQKIILWGLLAFCLSIFLFYKISPAPFERMKVAINVTTSTSKINKTDAESTAVRILIWEESVKLIKKHIWFGVSPGDANDKLIQAYKNEGLEGALIKKLNAHNQFLQTFIGTGFVGFVLLLILTIGILVYGFVKKNHILSLFSILIVFNFLVESMLQAQAGFIFFVFFCCLFLQYNLHLSTKINN
jgi:O-antigen ligase